MRDKVTSAASELLSDARVCTGDYGDTLLNPLSEGHGKAEAVRGNFPMRPDAVARRPALLCATVLKLSAEADSRGEHFAAPEFQLRRAFTTPQSRRRSTAQVVMSQAFLMPASKSRQMPAARSAAAASLARANATPETVKAT